jgi:hypothetical protein
MLMLLVICLVCWRRWSKIIEVLEERLKKTDPNYNAFPEQVPALGENDIVI